MLKLSTISNMPCVIAGLVGDNGCVHVICNYHSTAENPDKVYFNFVIILNNEYVQVGSETYILEDKTRVSAIKNFVADWINSNISKIEEVMKNGY